MNNYEMRVLYVAYYIDKSNTMNQGSDSEANVFVNHIKTLYTNYDKIIVREILSFKDLKSFVNDEIDTSNSGTFIFYFNGSGHQEKNILKENLITDIVSLIFNTGAGKVEEVKNEEILRLINKPKFDKIKFNFLLDSCNTGQFIVHAKKYNNVPILVLTGTSEDSEINSSFLTNFLNIVFWGFAKMYIDLKSFEALFDAWFGINGGKGKPQVYCNKKFMENQIIFY